MAYTEDLAQNALFSCLGTDGCAALLADPRTSLVTLADGEILPRTVPGSSEPTFAALVKGTLEVYRRHENARVLLNEIRAPGLVGAAGLFGEGEPPPTTVAAKKQARLIVLRQSQMEELITKNGAFALSYIRFLSGRVRFLNDRIASFTSGASEDRLWRYLQTHAKDGTVSISRSRLAQELDVGRASLYRALDTLAQAGRIQTDGKMIILLEKE